ncbi:group II intron reverse transcriptase/maturase [Kitasatospora sp. NPDC056531]|uniref:HNH endonuclease n=1 Tax=Kitasatospora sp. NPDC056531 TaxID=3345856 RepID=UPI0036878C55
MHHLGRLQWVMETSLLKTLARKHRSTVSKTARKYRATVKTADGTLRCFQVTVPRGEDRQPLVSRFGGISLKRQRTAVLTDQRPVMASAKRNELIHRLLAECCEICESRTKLEVHHVRKLADLNRPGRRDKPAWVQLMAKRRRKTLVTCRRCHEDIHAGRGTAPLRK